MGQLTARDGCDRVRYWWRNHVGLVVTTDEVRRNREAEMFRTGLEVGQELAARGVEAHKAPVRHLKVVHDERSRP